MSGFQYTTKVLKKLNTPIEANELFISPFKHYSASDIPEVTIRLSLLI